ncbi:MAG TPA: hypothetical protein VKY19_23970 [Ktedonosporobacter sp.]|jgi:hypothetical protein|nr:hypothetical protein [Ktedonosporobacter sp.]
MDELNWLDSSAERPTYSNEEIAALHQAGLLSRSEAEALDIIQTGFALIGEDDIAAGLEEEEQRGGEQWEAMTLAIIQEGSVIPILNLEEFLQRPKTMVEKLGLCRQVANIVYDVLLTLLDKEGGERDTK